MLQLILHGIGDYFIQTDWQALNKKKKGKLGLWACLKHCITYSLLFFFIADWKAVSVIFITHFIIDRTNIVAYLLAIKNGAYTTSSLSTTNPDGSVTVKIKKEGYYITNFGFTHDRPFAITIWLYIICDNLLHIICNYLALKYL